MFELISRECLCLFLLMCFAVVFVLGKMFLGPTLDTLVFLSCRMSGISIGLDLPHLTILFAAVLSLSPIDFVCRRFFLGSSNVDDADTTEVRKFLFFHLFLCAVLPQIKCTSRPSLFLSLNSVIYLYFATGLRRRREQ